MSGATNAAVRAPEDEGPSLLKLAYADAVDGTEQHDEVSERILDGALEQFCRFGISRSTMDEVARQAGVSRITVYRRFATKDVLVEQVVRGEFRRYFDQFLTDIRIAGSVEERVVVGFVSALSAIRHNRLIGGLMAAEPAQLAPSLLFDDGLTFATVQDFVAGQLRAEQAAGHVSADLDVALVAEMMVRVSTSFLLTPSRVVDLESESDLRGIAERFLVPMLQVR